MAVVIYTGAGRWRPDGAAESEGPPGPALTRRRMSRWSPFYFVDIRELASRESEKATLQVWLGRAEDEGRPEGMGQLRERVLARYPGRRFERFRKHVQLWICEQAAALGWTPMW